MLNFTINPDMKLIFLKMVPALGFVVLVKIPLKCNLSANIYRGRLTPKDERLRIKKGVLGLKLMVIDISNVLSTFC